MPRHLVLARSPLCLHATLAAARVLPVRTAMRRQQLLLTSNGTDIYAWCRRPTAARS